MSNLLKILKKNRQDLGLTQVELSQRCHISVPNIQNIETDRGNPSLRTLESIASSLGLCLQFRVKSANWDLLAYFGAPLFSDHSVSSSLRKQAKYSGELGTNETSALIQCLREACFELVAGDPDQTTDRERKLEAVQAMLLAIQTQFPSTFKKYCLSSKIISDLVPENITGRLIKLRRIALARLAEIL